LGGVLLNLCATSRLHIAVTNKAAFTSAATRFGTAHGLQVVVLNKTALTSAPTRGCAAMGLLVCILDKPALTRTAGRWI
jgi:hypothetical protein